MKLTQEQLQKSQQFYSDLIAKAWEDAKFKERLVANPNETLTEYLGKEINDKIIVQDQSEEGVIYINIPKKVNMDDVVLSDEALDMVSGGDRNFGENVGYYGAMFFDWAGEKLSDLATYIGESEMNNVGPKY